MSSPVNFFQSIGSDSFNIIPEFFKDISNLNSTSNTQISKKRTINVLLNEDNNEIKRIKVIKNEISSSQQYTLPIAEAIKKIMSSSNLYLNYDKQIYEAGKALTEIFGNNLGELAIKALSKALYNNLTLTNLDLSDIRLNGSAIKVLAEALSKNTTLTNLDLSLNRLGELEGKSLAEALCKNTTLTNLDLSLNRLGELAGKSLAEPYAKIQR
ncbi:hypothetical protein F8M41_010813 [Gigaspora margarita]|uniref:Uncharacterized protein n=1 Tax=Gigaspora margarita TaxID=4874 RepID=A0A8H3X043_GIGMA|nr:hypothetical protein F8M41_010813 [Gigaspora margarita]